MRASGPFAVAAFLAPAAALACTCLSPATVEERLESYDFVFEGVRVGPGSDCDGLDPRACSRYAFHVRRVWKGSPGRDITVDVQGGPCGFTMSENEPWLVYARRPPSGGAFVIGACSRSSPSQDAAADLEKLGRGQTPEQAGRERTLSMALAGSTALLGIGVGLAAYRRRRRHSLR